MKKIIQPTTISINLSKLETRNILETWASKLKSLKRNGVENKAEEIPQMKNLMKNKKLSAISWLDKNQGKIQDHRSHKVVTENDI
jgi:hypothetical protein